jgi:chorismate synthase
VARVAAGALAKLVLQQLGVKITAYVSQVGTLKLTTPVEQLDLAVAETNAVRCPDAKLAEEMFTYIDDIRKQGDSVGGVVSAYITGCPVGLGEPVFDKLHAELGKAMLSINAVKGFEYGSGFDGVELRGSQHNDIIVKDEAGKVSTVTNHSGGIQGGISNGEPIYFRVGFKPVATIMQDQASLNNSGEKIVVSGKGRHDPCVVPRAVPIVEAMSAIVLLDFYLRNRLTKLADVL